MKIFYELFIKELKALYDAENQQLHALPEMVRVAHSEKLKEAFHQHLLETKHQVKRLDEIAKLLKEQLSGYDSEDMKGLIKEAHKVAKTSYAPMVQDAALINCAQRMEHLEIASYGILKAFSRHLNLTSVTELLDESAKEEGHFNKKLTAIAEGTFFTSGINTIACKKVA